MAPSTPKKDAMPVGSIVALDSEERGAIKALQAAVASGKATAYLNTLDAIERIRRAEVAPLEQAFQNHIKNLADEKELTFVEDGAQWSFNPDVMTFTRTK